MAVQWRDPTQIASDVFHQMDASRVSSVKTECVIPNDLEDSVKGLKRNS